MNNLDVLRMGIHELRDEGVTTSRVCESVLGRPLGRASVVWVFKARDGQIYVLFSDHWGNGLVRTVHAHHELLCLLLYRIRRCYLSGLLSSLQLLTSLLLLVLKLLVQQGPRHEQSCLLVFLSFIVSQESMRFGKRCHLQCEAEGVVGVN